MGPWSWGGCRWGLWALVCAFQRQLHPSGVVACEL